MVNSKSISALPEALTGEHTVEADNGKSHVDTTTVNIVTPVRTLASPTPVSTPTPTLTPIASQEMQTHASTPTMQPESSSASTSSKLTVPGFEAVFVITALVLAVAVSDQKEKEIVL